jgi:hypothetical protein
MSLTVEYHIDPPGPVLTDFYLDKGRVVMIMGPLGSAKTTTACQKIFRYMIDQAPNAQGIRPTRFYAVRNTYPDLETTTIKDWLELYGELGQMKYGHPPVHTLRFTLEDNTQVHSEVVFLALDRPDAIKKLRGSQVTGFWLNETKELIRGVVDMADLRHGRYPSMIAGGVKPSWHGMVGDYNAPDEDHYLYTMAEEIRPKGWTFYRQPGGLMRKGGDDGVWVENPNAENVENLPDGYYINGKEGKKPDWIKVNLANEYGFVMDGKPIYPEFVDSIHVAKAPLNPWPGRTIYVGIDFGLTPAAIFGQQDVMGRWQWIHELVTNDMGAKRFGVLLAAECKKVYPGFEFSFWGDPAGDDRSQSNDDDTPFKMLAASGVKARKAGNNDPVIRREAVAEPLGRLIDGKPGLILCPTLTVTRKGMAGGYCYKRLQVAGDDRFHDKPDKNKFSHPCEAGQYLMIGGGEGNAVVKIKGPAKPQAQPPVNDYDIF